MPDRRPPTAIPPAPLPRATVGLLGLVFFAVLIRTGWIGDDAAISMRTVLNVTHGFGLTFNIAERVQTFTHPLWLLILVASYSVIGNIAYAAFGLSIAVSLAAFWMAVRRAASPAQAWLVGGVLLFSRAFVDYSTSGLENPLSHLLIAWLVVAAVRTDAAATPRGRVFWFVGSLLYLTRPDLVLFAVPFIVTSAMATRPFARLVQDAVVGLLPAIGWTIFSLIYYGFPFPNTAYAKLGTGISRHELWAQGWVYLIDSLDKDPLTLVVVAFAVAMCAGTSRPAGRRLAAGLVMYLLYVVSIGGDFMSGRFLSAPLFAAVLGLGWLAARAQTFWISAGVTLGLVASAATYIPIYSNSRFDDAQLRPTGITDERGVFFKEWSLAHATRQRFRSPGWPVSTGTVARQDVSTVCGLLGAAGLDQGPYVHLLDDCALADPLMARMPARFNDDWRIGHFRRMIPAGYEDSVAANDNQLTDPQLHAFYDAIRQITREPHLFAPDRLRTIMRMNLGRYNRLINVPYYRHNGAIADIGGFAHLTPEATPLDAPWIRRLDGPFAITCEDKPGRRYIDASLNSSDDYKFTFLKGEDVVATMDIGKVPEHRRHGGMASHPLDLPPEATRRGFDTIVVERIGGDDAYVIGHLLIEGNAATDPDLYANRQKFHEPIAPR